MLAPMTQEERERLRAEFLRQASEGFDWMFDPNRQSDMRTFTQREDRAMEIGTGLVRWAIEHHVGGDAQARPSAAEAICPECVERLVARCVKSSISSLRMTSGTSTAARAGSRFSNRFSTLCSGFQTGGFLNCCRSACADRRSMVTPSR